MPEVHKSIRVLQQRPRLRPFAADNIGYMTQDEPVLRTPAFMPERCFPGCVAGLFILGLSSNGDIKGCLSMPDTHIEGNVLRESLNTIWHDPNRFAYNRQFDERSLSRFGISVLVAQNYGVLAIRHREHRVFPDRVLK